MWRVEMISNIQTKWNKNLVLQVFNFSLKDYNFFFETIYKIKFFTITITENQKMDQKWKKTAMVRASYSRIRTQVI